MAFSKFSIFDGRSRLLAPFRWHEPSPQDGRGSGRGYDPDQPRVPRGNPDGGQWTRGAAGTLRGDVGEERAPDARGRLDKSWIQLAANSKGPGSRWIAASLLAWKAYELIRAFREWNARHDLFGRQEDAESTVAITTVGGQDKYGVNAGHHTYTAKDDSDARRMRTVLIAKYPNTMDTKNIGRMPNNALFHAEVTVLLRAARDNGGTLAGKTFEVFVDRIMCEN